jgi:hypothetical protein
MANNGSLGGQPHTKSEMKTTFDKNGNGNGNGANGEEYAQAQKLGMGQGAQGGNKGKSQSCILQSKLLI